MKRIVVQFFLFVIAFIPITSRSQILPLEGSVLNYRIVGFSFPAKTISGKTSNYKIEIARGYYDNQDSFGHNITMTAAGNKNKIIVELAAFGCAYTWRTTLSKELHHFSVGSVRNVDSTRVRLRITSKAAKYKDAYVFSDCNRVLYGMDGRPVWFLPKIDSADNTEKPVMDLKMTPQGTITLLTDNNRIYELNYKGAVCWSGPNNNRTKWDRHALYHHEFTRLSNGHYMALGNEVEAWRAENGTPVFIKPEDNGVNEDSINHIEFGTIIEYDTKGKIIWQWQSSLYFKKLWLSNYAAPNNVYNDVHANGFFFDEKGQYLYISFKALSQVVKVKYPEGKVVNIYGDTHATNGERPNALFCVQHACKISKDGYLYLFDNNSCHDSEGPRIVMMQEPRKLNDSLIEIWSYTYPVETIERKHDTRHPANRRAMKTQGGNVIELPDGSMFVSQCKPYADLYIVSHNKKIIWSAVSERWNETQQSWVAEPEYRASIIRNRKELEHLIWVAENRKL